jgi:hypothetical protein
MKRSSKQVEDAGRRLKGNHWWVLEGKFRRPWPSETRAPLISTSLPRR